MSRCAVMPKIILLMMIIFYCQGFPLLNDEFNVTTTTTENDTFMSNESEIVTNGSMLEIMTSSPEPVFIEVDNDFLPIFNLTFEDLFQSNTNLSESSLNNGTFELLPTPARITTKKVITEKSCVSTNPSLWLIQQNISEIHIEMIKMEKVIKKISSDMAWLRIANICSAVLSASCIAPVLVILCRLKLPAPTI